MVLTVEPLVSGATWGIFRSTNRGGKSQQPEQVFDRKSEAVKAVKNMSGGGWGIVIFNKDMTFSRVIGDTNWSGGVSVSCWEGSCEVFVGMPDDADPIVSYPRRESAEEVAQQIAEAWNMTYYPTIEDYPGWP